MLHVVPRTSDIIEIFFFFFSRVINEECLNYSYEKSTKLRAIIFTREFLKYATYKVSQVSRTVAETIYIHTRKKLEYFQAIKRAARILLPCFSLSFSLSLEILKPKGKYILYFITHSEDGWQHILNERKKKLTQCMYGIYMRVRLYIFYIYICYAAHL